MSCFETLWKHEGRYAGSMRLKDPIGLPQRVRKARRDKGLSQEDLAGDSYSAAYVSHVEHGKRNPSYEALSYFAGRLGMTYDQLVTGRDPDAELRLEIKIQESIAVIHQGDPAGAEEQLRACLDQAQEMSSDRAEARAREGVALCLYRQGRIDEALAAYDALAATFPIDAYEERTTATVGRARCLFERDDVRDAIDILEMHEIRLKRSPAPDPTALLQVYSALIGPYVELGQMDKAKAVALKGSDVAPSSGDAEQLAYLFVSRAALLLEQGEQREALRFLARAEDTYKQLGWEAEAAKVKISQGIVFLEQDDTERAREVFNSALRDEHERISARVKARALIGLAQVERLSDAAAQGLELAREAIDLAGADLQIEAAEAHREAGMCASSLGDGHAALGSWKQALSLYRESGDRTETARTSRLIGDALMEMGEVDQAATAFREGLSAIGEAR